MKKVLFFITKSNWGGAQKQVFDITCRLNKSKFETKVVCGGKGLLVEKLQEENIASESIDDLKRDIHIGSEIRSFIKIFRILKNEKPDTIHIHSPKAGGITGLAGRILRIKNIIYTSHGWSFEEDRSYIQKQLIKIFSWLIVMLSHKTIVLSETEYKKVSSWPFINKKLIIINNGVENIEYLPKEIAREKLLNNILNKNENTKIVGTIAELHKNKGYQYAIEAISKMENIIYLIIGSGDEQIRIEECIKINNAENIFLLGYIKNACTYLKAFDIFLLPSIKEGLPYVLLESGKANIPIISTNVGGISDLIENHKSGIIIPSKKPAEIKNAISFVLENPTIIDTYTKNLHAKIERDYSIEDMVIKLEKLY